MEGNLFSKKIIRFTFNFHTVLMTQALPFKGSEGSSCSLQLSLIHFLAELFIACSPFIVIPQWHTLLSEVILPDTSVTARLTDYERSFRMLPWKFQMAISVTVYVPPYQYWFFSWGFPSLCNDTLCTVVSIWLYSPIFIPLALAIKGDIVIACGVCMYVCMYVGRGEYVCMSVPIWLGFLVLSLSS
jgi:hypothetical protein